MNLRVSFVTALLLGFFLAALPACSQDEQHFSIERKTVGGLPMVVATETGKAEAKVDAVDYPNRSIALTGSDGETEIFSVSPAARRFAEIKKGDVVRVEYSTRIVASVRKVQETPTTSLEGAVMRADATEKPGIFCTRKARIEATVESINYATRAIALKTVTGRQITLTADKRLKDLENVHVGDQVVFEYSESISIQVR